MNNQKKNRLIDKAFSVWGFTSSLLGLIALAIFIGDILNTGLSRLSWEFITSLPSRFPNRAGIYTALLGSAWILVLTTLIAFPIGVMAGIYLEEFQKKSRFANLMEINLSNLAGVPSIIYGLLGLELFVRAYHLGPSIVAGSLTLALLILPIIIVTTREALRAVPQSIKDASYSLGATKLQTIWYHCLPISIGGIFTGVILAISRAVGEAAPLIVVGALAYVPFAPKSPFDSFSVLPIQIFNWISRPQSGFTVNAAAGIIVLLLLTFVMNGLAIYLRYKWQKKVKL